jgi:hypothetical protein
MSRTHRCLAALAMALFALPAAALDQLPGIPGIGGGPTRIDPGGEIVFEDPDTDPPLIDPRPEPLALGSIGNDSIELVIHSRPGTNSLFRSRDGGEFVFLETVAADTRIEREDAGLEVGRRYCYRLDVTHPVAFSDFICATTDWRVGFEQRLLTAEETGRVLELFDWRDTEPLGEGTAEAPALYYMNVFVDDPEAPAGLRGIGVHVQDTPVFGEELAGFRASSSLIEEGGRVTGRWHFAVVPGHFYNQIRERVLAQIASGQEPGVRAAVFRQLPVLGAREFPLDRHRLSHQYLGERGFEFNGEAVSECVFNEEFGGEICPFFLGWAARKLAGWIEEGAESLVEGIRTAIGHFQLIYTDDVDFSATFRVLNTDPAFGTERFMVSGWTGEVLVLDNVRIQVRQGIAAFYGHTDSEGRFHKTVLSGVDTRVCVETENHVAELTEFLTEEVVCVADLGELAGTVSFDLDVRDPYLNLLAQMTDAHDYVETVWGHPMPKITVLVGEIADTISLTGRSFSPCMGRMPSAIGVGLDVLLGLIDPGLLFVSGFIEFNYAVDIVLLPNSEDSRGVGVHEYGHAVMCSLIGSQGVDAFQLAWTDVIFATADQSAGNDTSYLTEAFADFLTSQVVGGTNYATPAGNTTSSMSVRYCEAGEACVENNFSSESTFINQVARVVSLLHDAFDGPGNPNDGSHWADDSLGGLQPARALDSLSNEAEVVELAPTDLPAIFEHWDERGTLLNESNFLGGLGDLLQERGYSEAEVCALFELHDSGTTCPSFALAAPWMGWLTAETSPAALFASIVAEPTRPGLGTVLPARWLAAAPTTGLLPPSAAPRSGEQGGTTEVAGLEAPLYPIAILEGVQKTSVKGLGKSKRESAFAFRLGEGWFEALAPTGAQLGGGWSVRNESGTSLRLHPAPEFDPELAGVLEVGLQDLGEGDGEIEITGPPEIRLKLRGDDGVVGKITIPFLVGDGEGESRGSYVAKLRGTLH